MKKHILCAAIVVMLLLPVLTGCSSSAISTDKGKGTSTNEANYDSAKPELNDSAYPAEAPAGEGMATQRKVIFSYEYHLETKDMPDTLASIEASLAAGGGFVASANYGGRDSDGNYTHATIIFRLPVNGVGSFKDAIERAGYVYEKNESGNDITDEYYDVEARLKSLLIQEERLLAMLEQSGQLTDLIEIERELARVRTEVERLTGSLRKYDDLVELATFTVYVRNVETFTPIEKETFWKKLGNVVVNSANAALQLAQFVLFMIIYILPYLLLIGIVLLIIILILRRKKRKTKK